jgi:hypothetical protein
LMVNQYSHQNKEMVEINLSSRSFALISVIHVLPRVILIPRKQNITLHHITSRCRIIMRNPEKQVWNIWLTFEKFISFRSVQDNIIISIWERNRQNVFNEMKSFHGWRY